MIGWMTFHTMIPITGNQFRRPKRSHYGGTMQLQNLFHHYHRAISPSPNPIASLFRVSRVSRSICKTLTNWWTENHHSQSWKVNPLEMSTNLTLALSLRENAIDKLTPSLTGTGAQHVKRWDRSNKSLNLPCKPSTRHVEGATCQECHCLFISSPSCRRPATGSNVDKTH